MKILPAILFLCYIAAGCNAKKDLGTVTDFVKNANIGTSQQVYVLYDNSCNICFHVLINDLKKTNMEDRKFILITPRKKFHFDEFYLNKYFLKENFYLTDNEQLRTLVTKYTNDIKGPYKLSVSNGKITDISVVTVN
jgi:uncharacterized protein YxjI